MIQLTKEQMHEIYEELDMGMRCFYNPATNKILSMPDFLAYPDFEPELWQEVMDEIDANKVIEFDKLPTRDYFNVMEEFAENVDDPIIRDRLIRALSRPKPFRNFKYEIDDSGDYREKWFEFKAQAYRNWIEKQVR